MKPTSKNAAYIQDVRLRENKPWYRSPADADGMSIMLTNAQEETQ